MLANMWAAPDGNIVSGDGELQALNRKSRLEEAFIRVQPRLRRLAQARGVPAEALDDMIQETFLEAWRHLDRLRQPDDIDAWLSGICRNVCLRFSRSSHRITSGQISLSGALLHAEGEESGNANQACLYHLDLTEELGRHDLETFLDHALGFLPESLRSAIELYYLADLPQQEAAGRLGITLKAMELRLLRARRSLRQLLHGPLRASALEFGLALDQEEAQGWHETREWCSLCGHRRLRGHFEPLHDGRMSLRLRCETCSQLHGVDMLNTHGRVPLFGLQSFRPALKRVAQSLRTYWQEAVKQGWQSCWSCNAPGGRLQVLATHQVVASFSDPSPYRLLITCPQCEYTSTCSLAVFLTHPTLQEFKERHPRWITGPDGLIEFEGTRLLRVLLLDAMSSARLIILIDPTSLQIIKLFSE